MKISSEKREKLDLLRKLVSANSLTHPSQRTPAQVPAAFWADPEFASLALQKSRSFLEFVSSDLLTNMDFMTKMGMCSAVSLEDVGKKRPIDRDLALALLPSEKTSFSQVPANLQNDPEIAKYGLLDVLNQNESELEELAKSNSYNSRERVLDLVCANGEALKFLGSHYKDDRETVLAAICGSNGSSAYVYASPRLRKDKRLAYAVNLARGKRGRPSDSDSVFPDVWNWPLSRDFPDAPEISAAVILAHGIRTAFSFTNIDAEAYLELTPELRVNREVLLAFIAKNINENGNEYSPTIPCQKKIIDAGLDPDIFGQVAARIIDDPLNFLFEPKKSDPTNNESKLRKSELSQLVTTIIENVPAIAALLIWGWAKDGTSAANPAIIPAELWSDRGFARVALWLRYEDAFPLVNPTLLDDPDFFLSAIPNQPINEIPAAFKDNVELARILIFARTPHKSGNLLALFSDEVKGHRGFVRSLILSGADILRGATEVIRADRELVLESVLRNAESLQYANEVLRNDRELAMEVLRSSRRKDLAYLAFEHFSAALRADFEIVLMAVRRNGSCLQHASAALRANREIVLEAVTSFANAFVDILGEIKNDPEVQLTSLVTDSYARMGNFSNEIRRDRDIVRDCVVRYGQSFEDADGELKQDATFVEELKKIDLCVIEEIPTTMKDIMAGISVRTVEHRGRHLHLNVTLEVSIKDQQYSINEVSVFRDTEVLMTTKNMTFLEYEQHGPVGSYDTNSACNSLCLIGDFVFYLSWRSLDNVDSRSYPTHQESDGSELWLIDLPKLGVEVMLYRDGESDGHKLLSSAGLHLLNKSDNLEMQQGVSLNSDGEKLYRCLREIVQGADPSLFNAYGVMKDDVFVLKAPDQIDACGGAASVCLAGYGWRWLLPREDGFYTWEEQKARLGSTTYLDDWIAIRDRFLPRAGTEERSAVRRHFHQLGDANLVREVDAVMKTYD